ncbi:MAG: hypothetical protein LBB60_10400 [Desulfovibrio sp.]|jgi:hypothetical protein|nr:hypothetical protein [Desulfovibrio sp.]
MTTIPQELRQRPIIFSGPMVRATLEGCKTQTRLVIKPQPQGETVAWGCGTASKGFGFRFGESQKRINCPYGEPGDRLWVKEAWAYLEDEYEWSVSTSYPARKGGLWYKADNVVAEAPYRSSIHMPRWASRITLEITGIRVERLQKISEEDALAEGVCETEFYDRAEHFSLGGSKLQGGSVERCAFIGLWDSINGKRPGCSWDDNPWVFSISFRRI